MQERLRNKIMIYEYTIFKQPQISFLNLLTTACTCLEQELLPKRKDMEREQNHRMSLTLAYSSADEVSNYKNKRSFVPTSVSPCTQTLNAQQCKSNNCND